MKETSDNKTEENRPLLQIQFQWWFVFLTFIVRRLPKAFSAITADLKLLNFVI